MTVRLAVVDLAMHRLARITVIPNIATKLYHHLRLPLRNQIRNNLPFVATDVHEILFGPTIFVNGFQQSLWRTTDFFYGRMAVYEV